MDRSRKSRNVLLDQDTVICLTLKSLSHFLFYVPSLLFIFGSSSFDYLWSCQSDLWVCDTRGIPHSPLVTGTTVWTAQAWKTKRAQ